MKKSLIAMLVMGIFQPSLTFGEDVSANSGFTGSFGKAGLIVATTTTKLKVAAPNGAGVDFAIHGLAYELADTDNITVTAITGDTFTTQPVLSKCLYLVQVDKDGNVTVRAGKYELTAAVLAGRALQWPTPSADCAPIAGFKITLASTATFLPGTTAFDAANVTVVYYDFMGGMPSKPILT